MTARIAVVVTAMLIAVPAAAQAAGARQACRADYQTLCSGVHPGGGRIITCFRQHAGQLSPGCADALKAQAENRNQGG